MGKPNAVEDALNRSSPEQRERAEEIIQEARSKIQLVSVRQGVDVSSTDVTSVARNAEIIEEAKKTIPAETMKDVGEISPPLPTPPIHGKSNSNVIEISDHTKSRIEDIEHYGGNNYLNDNAVNRAINRETQDMERIEHQQSRAMER